MDILKNTINTLYENKHTINPENINSHDSDAIHQIINMLDKGEIRISEKINNQWVTHNWIKKAVQLFLIIQKNKIIHGLETTYYDKIDLKYSDYNEEKFKKENVRVVPQATVRYGSFIGTNSVLMPCYVNIGAYIGQNTMIDTWATVGSCAQIGNNVHLSGGVGIGGVLEPMQSNPTIIEDNCFIGARSEIVEGVIVEEGSVISMGVYIGQSTKIYDRKTGKIFYGKIPSQSVVVPGNLPSSGKDCSLYCAVIVKKVDSQTLSKVEINELLRNCDSH
ncbi:2,3,4,5-tetrahydropyridine-2,6-dicarboxylate N-succinyltransferase [Buchnera aphidicola (Thelaxes californica)]|uniref:2,3,4,5-tetrahydropyridine-2,6-dicarboxylate N-succinyltransferase n=1 Tax=Buchnera aphidicola (Thelaxes californica) TaxID=1315998 RepID=A0A4D6YAA5_9GAMM|nr:2,3,4,5-tetrahydropyridine-2,6-dicarboxylate N-succinyltransferase [Buchnera aphidicola]QCI26717.1 2,3,4,5-tetrahydropyridine-2,6-dicarboxylate N-succinyltransferase [Buchnera aphidicola (Thelaxes californica)]